MHELKIPPCSGRATDGSGWPRHRAKARSKYIDRRRRLAALNKENDCVISYSQ
jgi:hypothetical protein